MARLLIWCLVWMQVHWSEKSSCWKQFLSNGEKSKEVTVTSRRPHVETSQRRDVPTSRRPHVATPQHHDVGSTMQKSTSGNVMTSQRRDVNSRSAPHHLKYEWLRNQGIGRRTNEGTEFQSRVTQTSRKCPGFVLFFHLWIFFGY